MTGVISKHQIRKTLTGCRGFLLSIFSLNKDSMWVSKPSINWNVKYQDLTQVYK